MLLKTTKPFLQSFFQKFVALCTGLLTICMSVVAQTGGDAVIDPENKGKKIDVFFYDLKFSAGAVSSATKANDLFVTDDMNGVRISIYGDSTRPAHPAAGVVDGSYYTTLIASINRAKAARGANGLKIFASKKLDGRNSFPAWVKDATGIIPSQYAILLADYIQYMATQGITIDVLGVDNERQYNEGNITPQKHQQTVDALRTLANQRGFAMPLIIGHEDYGPGRTSWMQTFTTNGWLNRIDLFGTHYYPHLRPKAKLVSDVNYAAGKPFWATEPHWDAKGTTSAEQMVEAEQAMCALWDQTDIGMVGFMWWNYVRSGNLRGNLMRAASVPLKDAQPIDIDDADGRDIMTLGKLQTRAFREGNTITVYAVNISPTAYTDYGFGLTSSYLDGDVSYTQWQTGGVITGVSGTATIANARKFRLTIPASSITMFSFAIKPNTPPVATLTSPINNQTFAAPATITLNASATDSEGSITKVEFFNGSVKLGEDLTAPYSFTWANVAVGSYTLTAKAIDTDGATGTSEGVAVSVQDQTAPTVPAGLVASVITQTSFTLNWTASTDNVSVTAYDVFRNNVLITTVSATSASISGLTCGTSGSYAVAARDAAGNVSARSTPLNVSTTACTVTYIYIDHNSSSKRLYANSTGTSAGLQTGTGTTVQWEMVSVDGTYFYLRHRASGKRLSTSDGTALTLVANTTTATTAQWKLVNAGSGWSRLENRSNGKWLHCKPDGITQFSLVGQANTGTNTMWKMTTTTAARVASSVTLTNTDAVHLFPNPTDRYVHIRWENAPNGSSSLTLTNLLGQQVRQQSVNWTREVHLSVQDLPEGIYLLRIEPQNAPPVVRHLYIQR